MAGPVLYPYGPIQPIPPRFEGVLQDFNESASQVIFALQSSPRFEFVRRVGDDGAQGGALLYIERQDGGTFLRQLIVKYYDTDGDNDADDEFNVLTQLRGSEHIVQLLGPGRAELGGRIALFMEYVAHGELETVLDRFSQRRQSIPNRTLWSIFLCCVWFSPLENPLRIDAAYLT